MFVTNIIELFDHEVEWGTVVCSHHQCQRCIAFIFMIDRSCFVRCCEICIADEFKCFIKLVVNNQINQFTRLIKVVIWIVGLCANLLLTIKNKHGRTPLQIATNKDASDEITSLLKPQFNSLKHKNSSTKSATNNEYTILIANFNLNSRKRRNKYKRSSKNTNKSVPTASTFKT